MKFKPYFLSLPVALCLLASCSQKDAFEDAVTEKMAVEETLTPQTIKAEMNEFATALSKAVYQNGKVRSFLKEEALKKFDTDYDVLYYPLRNSKIDGDKTLRDILVENSSEETIAKVENHLPLLNILIPRMAYLNVLPENLDVEDKELPVAINNDGSIDLYLNGEVVDKIDGAQVPAFNVIVVNQNKVVKASKTGATRANADQWTYSFKEEGFDNRKTTRGRTVKGDKFDHSKLPAEAYKRAIEAYNAGFTRNDTSIYQAAFQRDHIYYGMTPTKRQGSLNHNITEYLVYMTVSPTCFSTISDQLSKTKNKNDDPRIRSERVTNYKAPLSEDELIKRMWTDGAYKFVFEYNTSNSSVSTRISATVYPEQIWDFNIFSHRRNPTLFRHSKYYYYIYPRDFTPKKYYFDPTQASFGKWNLANESLTRYISIYEMDDEGTSTTSTVKEIFQYISKNSFKGDMKINLGGKKDTIGSIGLGAEFDNTNNYTKEWTFSYTKNEKNEMMVEKFPIYFYDPIVLGRSGNTYTFKEYGAGDIKFAIDAR